MGYLGISKEKEPKTGEECLERGNNDLYEGNFRTAFDYFEKGAKKFDHGECQYVLGKQYIYADMTESRDFERAVSWLKKAANNGVSHYDLFFLLGVIYLVGGEGIVANKEEALQWIEKAALIDSDCYMIIGKGYFQGKFLLDLYKKHVSRSWLTVKKDYERALEFYLEAKKRGLNNYKLFVKIAKVYFEGGYGVEKDYEKALFWTEESIDEEYRTAKCNIIIVQIYGRGGFGVTKNLEKAIKICSENEADLSLEAGLLYQYSVYPPEYKKAFKWYKKALDYYNLRGEASLNIGMLYLKGLGVSKDKEKGASYLSETYDVYARAYRLHYGIDPSKINYEGALENYENVEPEHIHYGQALNQIGTLYKDGLGVDQSHEKALEYFTLAAENQCSEAYNSLGDVYKYGYGVDIDYTKAFEWYTRAAEEPFDNNGQFNLGMMYLEGKGTDINFKLALHWFERAQIFGNEMAHPSFMILADTLSSIIERKAPIMNTSPELQLENNPLQFFHVEDCQYDEDGE